MPFPEKDLSVSVWYNCRPNELVRGSWSVIGHFDIVVDHEVRECSLHFIRRKKATRTDTTSGLGQSTIDKSEQSLNVPSVFSKAKGNIRRTRAHELVLQTASTVLLFCAQVCEAPRVERIRVRIVRRVSVRCSLRGNTDRATGKVNRAATRVGERDRPKDLAHDGHCWIRAYL